jgi:hypothetical protein
MFAVIFLGAKYQATPVIFRGSDQVISKKEPCGSFFGHSF